ncbi:MAG: hypothetical protein NW215_04030 [Hyphomicrobiales bacterium]|nr:hypothetical protein [Hyphomicrobiales bacterium]
MRGVIAAIFVATFMPQVQAATCAEGLIMLQNTLSKVGLSEDEQIDAQDLMFQAKVEYDRGNAQVCKYIVADVIRFFVLKERRPPNG